MRLGFGDYEEPDHPESNWATRDFFLEVVAKMAPEVLEKLRTRVLPLYSELPDELRQRPPKYVEAELKDGWSVIERAEASESVRRFKEALVAWASSHGLQVDWVLNRALATLHAWSYTTDAVSATTPPPRYGLQVHLTLYEPTHTRDAVSATTRSPRPLRFSGINRSWGHRVSEDEMFYVFKYAGWDPRGKRKKVYKRMVEAVFRKDVGEYLDRVEEDAVARGMVQTREWRRRDEQIGRRIRWLVQRRVLKLSVADIATADRVPGRVSGTTGLDRVRAGLRLAARQIGLPPGKPGRPRRSTGR